MGDHMRIMGIYAHPADVATEAAGTMAIHADRGDELARVIVRYRPDVILTHYPIGPYLIDSNAFAGIYATRAMHLATTLIPRSTAWSPISSRSSSSS